jgi:Tfp pilus assembly protein PilV
MKLDRWQGGFTLNEVLVAMNVVVVAVLAYSLSSGGIMRGRLANDNVTVAIHLAHDKMEQLKAQTNLANDNRCPGAGEHGLSPSGSAGGIFDRCWSIADSSFGAGLKQVDVRVSWQDYENREIAMTTLVFVGNQ